jgi:hypothetical protein
MAKEVIEIDVKTNISGAKSLSDLRNEFKEIQKELSSLTPGTEKYIDTLKRLGSVKDEIGDLKDQIQGFAGADKKISAVTNVVGGLASGFQAAQGAAAIFGSESENLEKTLLRIQAVMAFTQGIQGIASLGDSLSVLGNVLKSTEIGAKAMAVAQRILNAVMSANPIGLLIAGITALIGVIALFVNAMEDEDEAQKQVIANREREIEVMQSQDEALKRQAEFRKQLAVAQGKSAEDLLNIEKRLGDERKKRIEEEIVLINKNINDRNKLLANADSDELKKIQENNDKDAKLRKSLYEERIKIDNDFILNKTKLDTDNAKAEEERRKAAAEKARQEAEKKRQKDLENAEKWRQEQAKFIQYELDAFANKFGEEEQIIAEQQLSTKIALGIATPDEVEAYQKEINARKLKAEKEYNDAVDAELKRLKEIEDKRRADEDAKIKAEYDKRVLGHKQLQLQLFEWTKQGLEMTSQLNELFAGKSEAEQRKAFEIDKGVKLASATMSGIEGTMNAYKTAQGSPITGVFPAYPFVQAGIAAAFAAVNVAKIAKTKFGGTEKAEVPQGGANLGTFSQGGGTQAPGLTSQNNVTQLNPDGSVAGQGNREMQPVKAYVVESESRAVTDRVNKLSNQSKIG